MIDDIRWTKWGKELEESDPKYAPFTVASNSIVPGFVPDQHPMRKKWLKSIHAEENPSPNVGVLVPSALRTDEVAERNERIEYQLKIDPA